jgi:WD40-like Beta Propeller Repeat
MTNRKAPLALVLAPGLIVTACGGAIDLDSPRRFLVGSETGASGDAGQSAGTSSTAPVAGSGSGPSGGAPGAGGKSQTEPPPMGNEAGEGGSPVTAGPEERAWLAFDAQPEGEHRGIYWLTAPTSSCLERLSPQGVNAKQPAFSKDGRLIAYAGEDADGVYQIFAQELDGGDPQQVTDLPQGASYPVFTPWGAVVFVTGDPEALREGLVEDSADTGNVMLVSLKSLEVSLIQPRDEALDYPYFAPAFAAEDRLLLSNSYSIDELRLDLTGATPLVIGKRTLTPPGVPQEPAPSPDGMKVIYPDTCSDTLTLYKLDVIYGSPRSCSPPSRDYLPNAGVRSPDWGAFGYIAVEHNDPTAPGLRLYDERDLSIGPPVPTPKRARNPSWAPADFTRRCR